MGIQETGLFFKQPWAKLLVPTEFSESFDAMIIISRWVIIILRWSVSNSHGASEPTRSARSPVFAAVAGSASG